MSLNLMQEEDTVNRFIEFIEMAASKDKSGMLPEGMIKDLMIALRAMKIAFIASTAMAQLTGDDV